ncbi:MAG: hypothetical protein HY331_05945 [Chloroflexi bacterium]|nr:hypothetical protein [Chloroflexota bacterium]
MAKLLGEYLLDAGAVTPDQLAAALERHAELARNGEFRFIGQILVDLNFVRPDQVEQALELQRQERMGLRIEE